MQEQLMEAWRQVQTSMSAGQTTNAAKLAVFLLAGGLLALFIKWLYQHFGKSMSNRDSVTRVFPLLTLVTIGVITVVKTSLALSLGLVGALSIVRFRAAIKEPEELVYLFLCIGVGLASVRNSLRLPACSSLSLPFLSLVPRGWNGAAIKKQSC